MPFYLTRLLGRVYRNDDPDDLGGGDPDDQVENKPDIDQYLYHQRAALLENIASQTEQEKMLGEEDNDPEPNSDPEPQDQTQADPEPQGEMVTLLVDGKEVQKPLSEVLDAGKRYLQKDMTADERIAEATKILKEAKQFTGNPDPQQHPSSPVQDVDDAELARAIQLGTDEEAKEAIRKLRTSGKIGDDSITSMIDARIEFREAAAWVQKEYEDVLKDPILGNIFMQKEMEARQKGDSRGYRDLYTEIGEGLRKWRDGLTSKNTTQDKQARKERLTVVPTASARAPSGEHEPDEADGDDTASFIAEQKRRRGQTG